MKLKNENREKVTIILNDKTIKKELEKIKKKYGTFLNELYNQALQEFIEKHK